MRHVFGLILFIIIAHYSQTYVQAQADKTTVEYNLDLNMRLQKGDPAAQYEVGMNLLGKKDSNGSRAFNDTIRGQKFLFKAANQNHAQAQYTIARFYYLGKVITKNSNEKEAARWYLAAANNGHAKAQDFIAGWYERGNIFPLNQVEATKWYRASAMQGNSHAQVLMGKRSEKGLGMAANKQNAIYWYKLAATQGNTFSQERLRELNRKTWGNTGMTSNEVGKAIGAILIAQQQAQKRRQEAQERRQQEAQTSTKSDPEYLACYSRVNKRIATCGVSMGQCDVVGCGTEVTCNKGLAAWSCKSYLQGAEYGQYFCDTRKRNNINVSRKVVIDEICVP